MKIKYFSTIIVFIVFINTTMANEKLSAFETETGYCDPTQMDSLRKKRNIGTSITLFSSKVFKRRGSNTEPTDTSISPMTYVTCHIKSGEKILISVTGDNKSYCGWIKPSTLLGFGDNDKNGECGKVNALSIKKFCEKMKTLERIEECTNGITKEATFETKFIINNTSVIQSENKNINPVNIPIFPLIDSNDLSWKKAKIFNVMRIFDAGINKSNSDKKNKEIRYLIGTDRQHILGWIKADSGTVWYSKLTTFFSHNNTENIFSDIPGADENKILSTRPSNLKEMLNASNDFQKYPVLSDYREKALKSKADPYLRIAFIGSFCTADDNKLCSELNISTAGSPSFDMLNQADILFLIDGTRSMRKYFKFVTRAIQNITKDYIGNLGYKVGVAMYGDFKNKNNTSITDEIQFKFLHELSSVKKADKYNKLINTVLYIKDPMQDSPEAVNAALLQAIEKTNWRGTTPKYIIHIADHGDREKPSELLLNKLIENKIFYFRIAVKGDEINDASSLFVENGRYIKEKYRIKVTDTDKKDEYISIATPVKITYNENSTTDSAEYKAISQALLGAIQLGNEIKNKHVDEIFSHKGKSTESASNSESSYLPGYSALTNAAKKLFKLPDASDVEKRTVASWGNIRTVAIGEHEPNWDYFAQIAPNELGKLESIFGTLCQAIADSDPDDSMKEAIMKALEILTGDKVTEENYKAYYSDKSKIPLSSMTLIGEGLQRLIDSLNNPNAKKLIKRYQREVCRTERLMELMDSSNKLLNPYEGNGGDLIWSGKPSFKYTYKNSIDYNWIYTDIFGHRSVFLPLSYLPGNQK